MGQLTRLGGLMAGFEGWWVNGETGKGRHVAEHWMEIRSNPESYGVSQEEMQKILKDAGGAFNPGDTSPDGARGMLLKAAMKNGWVRVRGYQGKYSIQTYGRLASRLPKVLKFLKGAGVHPNSEIFISDLASDYNRKFMDGMSDVHKALKQGNIPDSGEPKVSVKDVIKGGISSDLPEKAQRGMLRQQIGQRTHLPDPDPGDDKIEEKALAKGFAKLLG